MFSLIIWTMLIPLINILLQFRRSQKTSILSYLQKYHSEKFNVISTFKFKTVNKKCFSEALSSIISNAMGSDGISLKMVHLIFDQLIDHIIFILNKCIISCTFPDAWRTVLVLTIPESDNPKTLNNLRPISLSKLLEKILHKQLQEYLFTNAIIPTLD